MYSDAEGNRNEQRDFLYETASYKRIVPQFFGCQYTGEIEGGFSTCLVSGTNDVHGFEDW